MSKKRIFNKHFDKGRFYHRSDKNGGHPALIVKKNDKKNQYGSLVFTSTIETPRTIKLKKSIDIDYPNRQYCVHIDPFIGKRRDFGKKELSRLKVAKEDKSIIKKLKKDSRFSSIK